MGSTRYGNQNPPAPCDTLAASDSSASYTVTRKSASNRRDATVRPTTPAPTTAARGRSPDADATIDGSRRARAEPCARNAARPTDGAHAAGMVDVASALFVERVKPFSRETTTGRSDDAIDVSPPADRDTRARATARTKSAPMSSLASVPQGAFAALRASRAGAGLRRVPVSRTSPPVRCSPGDVSATAAAVSSPPEPQDGSHRLVYVGNLDFFTPPDAVRTGLSASSAPSRPPRRPSRSPAGAIFCVRTAPPNRESAATMASATADSPSCSSTPSTPVARRRSSSTAPSSTDAPCAPARACRPNTWKPPRAKPRGLDSDSDSDAPTRRARRNDARTIEDRNEGKKIRQDAALERHAGPSATRPSPLGSRGRRRPTLDPVLDDETASARVVGRRRVARRLGRAVQPLVRRHRGGGVGRDGLGLVPSLGGSLRGASPRRRGAGRA